MNRYDPNKLMQKGLCVKLQKKFWEVTAENQKYTFVYIDIKYSDIPDCFYCFDWMSVLIVRSSSTGKASTLLSLEMSLTKFI